MTADQGAREAAARVIRSVSQGSYSSTLPGSLLRGASGIIVKPEQAADALAAAGLLAAPAGDGREGTCACDEPHCEHCGCDPRKPPAPSVRLGTVVGALLQQAQDCGHTFPYGVDAYAGAVLDALDLPAPSVRDATPERDALERLSEAATSGPWRARLYDGRWQVVDPDNDVVAECDGPSDQDNAFIAAAVNYVRAALAGNPDE